MTAGPRNDDDRSQARREAAALLGVDVEHLSPADTLRVDMVSALRLVIDAEQATVLDGGQADLGKLNIAVQSLIALLPGRELPAPPVNEPDPREIMWQTYLGMRRRGELGDKVLEERESDRLRARVAELEAQLAERSGVPVEPLPAGGNVVPLSRPTNERTSERSEVAPSPPPVAPVLGDLVSSGPVSFAEDPQNYVLPDGSISPTPFGGSRRWWGPA